jgi:uncharacterized protein YndB with AHSA1/START domain
MSSTEVTRHFKAPRSKVYAALIDGSAVARWMVPEGMTSQVHAFDAREGGAFRISLTYQALDAVGKSSAHTDTYHGHFVKLVPDSQVVEVMEFETDDPALQGEMTVAFTLSDVTGGTAVHALHTGVPPGVSPADNALGWQMSLTKLAGLVEQP